ncbi:MAG: agmatinase [Deltaproteobacteria bacterium]|nr:agmatinase [Deltaproteobacteria bacterium]MBW1961560.1 agmatinase [Deltaproteobacteria bacterium]MBW2152349.1 agmatinase [Deltaproteobacteria bacterium]
MNRHKPLDPAVTPWFAGVPTFLRCPHTRNLSNVDVAIVGIPFDGACTYRPGARFGPRDVRCQSALSKTYNQFLKVNLFDVLSVIDYGDLDLDPMNIENCYRTIEKEVAEIIEAGVFPLGVGGDHSISLPIIRALAKKHGPLSMVHFDAHTDTWDTFLENPYFHGSTFKRAMEEKILAGDSVFQIGLRGGLTSERDYDFALKQGVRMITVDELKQNGLQAVIDELGRLKGLKAYVSLDIDIVDPAFAPGTGFPEVGGLTSHEIIQLVSGLRELEIVGFDLVEVLPAHDTANITGLLAAHLIFEFLSVLAVHRQEQSSLAGGNMPCDC